MVVGLGPTGSGHAGSNTFSLRIEVSTLLPPSSFVLRYAVVDCKHSENRPPLVPFPAVKIDLEGVQCFARPSKSFPPKSVPATESFSSFVRIRQSLLPVLHVEPPHFPGHLTCIVGNFLYYVETTGLDGAGHAVETMDAASEALVLLSEDIP